MFPADSFVPDRICPHMILDPKTGKPTGRLRQMEPGERLVCMGCHQSGYDDHPAMKPNPLVDPKPEPAEGGEERSGEAAGAEAGAGDAAGASPAPETRKQRRVRLFAEMTGRGR